MTKRILTFLLLAAVLFCAGCSRGNVSQKDRAPRIVSLAPALTELLYHLGCGKYLAGRTSVCNVPEEAQKLPVVGNLSQPDVERVLALDPTHVFAVGLLNPKTKPMLEKTGCLVHVSPAENLDQYISWVQFIGRELNVQAAAETEVNRINAWRKKCENAPKTQTKVLFVLWDNPLVVAGKETLADTAIQYAGAENAIQDKTGYFKCTPEILFDKNITFVVLATDQKPGNASPLYQPLASVDNRFVYFDFSQDELLRPGPRFTGAVDKLRGKIQEQAKENK